MPTTPNGQRVACGTCLFFVPHKGSEAGICRLNPPQIFLMGLAPAIDPRKTQANFQQVLPTMQANEWCSHWTEGNPYNRPDPAETGHAKGLSEAEKAAAMSPLYIPK